MPIRTIHPIICGVLLILGTAPRLSAQAGSAGSMKAAFRLRAETVAALATGQSKPEEALDRLRKANAPMGLHLEADGEFAFAAIDVGRRLLGGTTTTNVPAFTAGTPEAFTYDDDGNLISDGRWTRTYDAENRLVAMETTAAAYGTGLTRQKLEFRRDALGRMAGKKVYHYSSGWVLDSETRYVFDGANMIEELSVTGSIITKLRTHAWGLDWSGSLHGAGGVGGLLMTKDGSVTYLPMYDGNGNVIAYVDMASGAKSAIYEYGAFGETLIADGPAAEAMPFRFSTKYYHAEAGIYDFGQRDYEPLTGRWFSKDPLEELGHEALRAALSPEPEPTWQSVFEAATATPTITTEEVAPVFGGNPYLGMRNNTLSYIDPDGENPLLAGALAAARKLLLELLKKRGKQIAECEAIHRSYDALKGKCQSCKGCTNKAEAQKNAACFAAEVAGRALYLKKRCDYILLGSITRGSKRAEDGHKTQLAEKTAALAICTAKAASLPDPKP